VAGRLTPTGTLRVEWQCNRYAQGQVAVRFTLPLDGERTGPVRSGPSGSAAHGNRYAQGRVAVPAETAPNS